MREVQGEKRDEGRQAGQDEERARRDEGSLPDVRDRALPDHGFLSVPASRLKQVRESPVPLDSQAKALLAARAALDKQAEHVTVLDLRTLSTVADFFVVCTAGSGRQIDALREHIEATLDRVGCAVWHTEGTATAPVSSSFDRAPQWVLMDCGEIVVHLLDQPARSFYRLEDLWADAPRIPVDS